MLWFKGFTPLLICEGKDMVYCASGGLSFQAPSSLASRCGNRQWVSRPLVIRTELGKQSRLVVNVGCDVLQDFRNPFVRFCARCRFPSFPLPRGADGMRAFDNGRPSATCESAGRGQPGLQMINLIGQMAAPLVGGFFLPPGLTGGPFCFPVPPALFFAPSCAPPSPVFASRRRHQT